MTNAQSIVANKDLRSCEDIHSFENVFVEETKKGLAKEKTALLTKEKHDTIIKTLKDCNSTDDKFKKELKNQ